MSYCTSCVEEVYFVVPDLPPQTTTVVLMNGNGSSPALPFTVLPSLDTGFWWHTGDSSWDSAHTGHTGFWFDTGVSATSQ
jgi:hypothetical protein